MNRAELVDDVENVITKTYFHGGDWDDCAAAAVDAVLSAVADDLDGYAQEQATLTTLNVLSQAHRVLGIERAADAIRSLLTGGKE